MSDHQLICTDASTWLADQPDDSVDLVFCSPPYEAARSYGELGFNLKEENWVEWAVPLFRECVRVSRGLTAWVVQGQTRQYRWSCVPALLIADLHRAGVNLRRPAIYKRHGTMGSGGPDWLRNDWEFVVCATKPGRLPWSDNTALGHPPKWKPGGPPTNRMRNGRRVARKHKKREPDGTFRVQGYNPPKLVNPGDVVDCGVVGGGNIGHRLAHEGDAPFPEQLAEFFVRSFCPPGGLTLDIFSGSGTTVSVALQHGRRAIGLDVRPSQIELAARRLKDQLGVDTPAHDQLYGLV